MGAFLSTPLTDVQVEQGEGSGMRFIVGEMQGWRKTMEDSHIAYPNMAEVVREYANVPLPPVDLSDIALFGVFDGHGGAYEFIYMSSELVERFEFT